ncbi:MAG: HEAT repeat domain-containing protein [Candidatus Symbiothrix sp.]|jgi:hypothetical protein|nr:HEAT repeat domain-containing protein [Candidatus Symbiothrix sp.]
MKLTIRYLLIFFTLLSCSPKTQTQPQINNSKALLNIVNEIAQYRNIDINTNVLESEQVGLAGETTSQYKNFIQLRDKATIDELLELLKHEDSVVKGYASWALADRKYPNLSDILAEFLRTGGTATTQTVDIISEDDLASIFYYRVLYQNFHNKITLSDSLFFSAQTQKLDSVILYSPQPTSLLSIALKHNNANPKTYDRVRKIALIEQNEDAIKALAIYQNKKDIPDIINLREKAFGAISHFPDTVFWDFLLSYQNKNKSKEYFFALTAFKTEESTKVLSSIFTHLNNKEINYLCEALTKNYCTFYQNLLLKIWEQNKTIDIIATEQLIKDCPEKSALSFSKGLLNSKDVNFLEFDYNYGTRDAILPLMLDNISKFQRDKILTICKFNIPTAKFMDLTSFLSCIKENQLAETTEPLLNRLSKKNYPYEIAHLAETLLSFKDIETQKKTIALLKINRNVWNSGNWTEHFRELFEKYKIDIEK